MSKKRILFCLSLFILTISFYGQNNDVDKPLVFYNSESIYKHPLDSVKIALYFYSDKESSSMPPFDDKIEEKEYSIFQFIGDAILTQKEMKILNNFVTSSQSFCDGQALLYHADIEFKYYKNNDVVQRVLISSLTRNFIMFDQNEEVIVRNSIDRKFHHFIAKILKRCGFWSDELEFNFYENYEGNC